MITTHEVRSLLDDKQRHVRALEDRYPELAGLPHREEVSIVLENQNRMFRSTRSQSDYLDNCYNEIIDFIIRDLCNSQIFDLFSVQPLLQPVGNVYHEHLSVSPPLQSFTEQVFGRRRSQIVSKCVVSRPQCFHVTTSKDDIECVRILMSELLCAKLHHLVSMLNINSDVLIARSEEELPQKIDKASEEIELYSNGLRANQVVCGPQLAPTTSSIVSGLNIHVDRLFSQRRILIYHRPEKRFDTPLIFAPFVFQVVGPYVDSNFRLRYSFLERSGLFVPNIGLSKVIKLL